MTARNSLALLLAAALLSGCATARDRQLAEIPDRIEKGKTTREQVRLLLGEPDWTRAHPAGETWVYGARPRKNAESFVFNEAVGIGSSFIPIPFAGTAVRALILAGRSAGKGGPGRTQASVEFDRRGIVSDYTVQIPASLSRDRRAGRSTLE